MCFCLFLSPCPVHMARGVLPWLLQASTGVELSPPLFSARTRSITQPYSAFAFVELTLQDVEDTWTQPDTSVHTPLSKLGTRNRRLTVRSIYMRTLTPFSSFWLCTEPTCCTGQSRWRLRPRRQESMSASSYPRGCPAVVSQTGLDTRERTESERMFF